MIGPFDCCVLDLRLPDMTGFELLDKIQAEPSLRELPIVVFTGKDLTPRRRLQLKQVAKSIVLKDVQSPERLLDETALVPAPSGDRPAREQSRQMLERLHRSNEILRGRKVLVVDDDARNIFALTTVLENHDMEVLSATNGRQAIEMIQSTPDLSVVLMDIMMPEMDGYQTMREIRKDPKFRALPILALTAKAMKGDREKCLEAGASDYIAKPVNTEQLLSLLASLAVSIEARMSHTTDARIARSSTISASTSMPSRPCWRPSTASSSGPSRQTKPCCSCSRTTSRRSFSTSGCRG